MARKWSRVLPVLPLAFATVIAASPLQPTAKREGGLRTPSGRPDVQGIWSFATLTPLERPQGVQGPVFTEAEAKKFLEQLIPSEELRGRPTPDGNLRIGNYDPIFMDRGEQFISGRSSLIINPESGRVPLTAEARARLLARRGKKLDNPEDLSVGERCIVGINSGPPMIPNAYNNNVQIVQTDDNVLLVTEMVHTTRVVSLNGRPHLPSNIRLWTGDSVGRWEGDTLVVETTNFTGKTTVNGATEKMRLIERFQLLDADTLQYEFTVHDPAAFTQPWTARLPMTRFNDRMYEYACHEGNHSMGGMLRGARFADPK